MKYLQNIDTLIKIALTEDLTNIGDVSTDNFVPEETVSTSRLIAKEDAVFCGTEVIKRVFAAVDVSLKLEFLKKDGDAVKPFEAVCIIKGSARSILTAERTALNFVGHLSGISTSVRKYVDAVEGTDAQILDTRKTIPGYRMLAKYAVRVGGGVNHRIGLFDQVMIKDNHFKAIGEEWPEDIADRLLAMRKQIPEGMRLEVEVDTLDQLEDVLSAHPDIILLDNMGPDVLKKAVEMVEDEEKKSEKTILTEASGGITMETVRAAAECGVDRISIGAVTHSVKNADFSLEIE